MVYTAKELSYGMLVTGPLEPPRPPGPMATSELQGPLEPLGPRDLWIPGIPCTPKILGTPWDPWRGAQNPSGPVLISETL